MNKLVFCPYGCNAEENVEHVLFTCPHASQVWTAVGATLNQWTNMATSLLTLEQNHTHQPGSELAMEITAVAWNIWLARNRKSLIMLQPHVQQ